MNPNRVPDIVHWELGAEERPLWFGLPQPATFVRETTRWGRVLIGIPFTVVGLIMTPVALPLGVLLVVTGVCMLGAPVWNYFKARNTVYAVTNERLVVIERFFSPSVTSYRGDAIERVERREQSRGVGSLIFSRVETCVKREDGYDHSMVEEKGFFGIQDVGGVWRLVMDLKNQSA